MRIKKGQWDTLDSVLSGIWKMLDRGANRYNDPFHWPVLGTTGKEGPRLRCVILREFMESDRMLICHTDSRAAKVREITDADVVSWLFYHPKRKVQLRITGRASLHRDDQLADRQWSAAGITSRLNYCTNESPGTTADHPSPGLPDLLLKKAPSLLDTERGRANFMAIVCRIDAIDWLVLKVSGNRRARFEWNDTGLEANWLIP